MAIGIVKKWAAGVNPGGHGGGHKVHADVQAAAGKNIAEWEKDKADAHTHGETKTTMLDSEALELARDYERHGAHGTVHVRAYYSHRLMSHLRNVHGVTEDIGNDPEWHREVHVEDHEDMLATGTPSHHHLPEEDQAWMPIARVRPGSLGHLQSATRVADRHLHPLTATPNLDQVLGLAGGSPAAWPSGKPYDASFLPKPGKTPGDRTDLKQGDQRRPAGGAVASAPGTKPVTAYGHLMQAPSQTVSAGPPLPPGVSLPDPKEFEALASKIKDGPDRPLAESARTHLTTAAGKLRAEDKQGTLALLRIVQTDLHALYRKTVAANRPNEAQVFSEKGFAGSVPPAAQSSARAEMFASQDQMREYRTQVTTVAQWVDRFRRSYFHGQYQGVAEGRFTGGSGGVALAGPLGEDAGKDQVKHPAGPKATKPQAHYRATDSDTKRCGTCSKLRVNPPDFESHSCIAVAGDIDPKKVCDYFVLNPDATSHALVKMARGYDRVEHGRLEHVSPYEGKQPFKFYHGTREEFAPGQVLSDKRRYYTPHRALAGNYSAGSTARSGRGERHVYEVEPVEGHEIDPEYGDSGYGWMARKIRVVREVSHAGTDEPGDVMPSRAALRKAVRKAAASTAAKLTEAQVTNALVKMARGYDRVEHGRLEHVSPYTESNRRKLEAAVKSGQFSVSRGPVSAPLPRPAEPARKAPDDTHKTACHDCQTETAPWRFGGAAPSEDFVVHDNVWKAGGLGSNGGRLCVGCLEKRIGRRLNPSDFPYDAKRGTPALNAPGLEVIKQRYPGFHRTARLEDRMGLAEHHVLTDAQVTNALLALTEVDPYKRIEHGRVVLVKGYETAHRQGHFWDSHGVKHWGWYGAAGVLPTHTDEHGVQRFLIQKRAGGVQHSGTWSTAGGAIDIDPKTGVPETPQVAAQREAEEEFGDKIPHMTPTHVDTAHFGDPGTAGHWQYHTVHLEAPEMFKPSGKASHGFESGGHAWVTAQEMGEYPLHPNFAEYATSKLGVFLNPDKQAPDKPKWEPPSPPDTDFRKGDVVEYFHKGQGLDKNVPATVEKVPDWQFPTYLVQPHLKNKAGKYIKAIELHRKHIVTDPSQFGHPPLEIPKPEVAKYEPKSPPPPGPEGMGKPREPGKIRQGDDVKWTDGNGKERTGRVSYVHSDGAVDVSKPYVAPKGGGYGSGGNVVSHGLGYAVTVNTGKSSGFVPPGGPTPNPEAYAAGAGLAGEPVVKGERVVHDKMGLGTAKGKQASDGYVHILFDSGQTAYINVKSGALRRDTTGAAAPEKTSEPANTPGAYGMNDRVVHRTPQGEVKHGIVAGIGPGSKGGPAVHDVNWDDGTQSAHSAARLSPEASAVPEHGFALGDKVTWVDRDSGEKMFGHISHASSGVVTARSDDHEDVEYNIKTGDFGKFNLAHQAPPAPKAAPAGKKPKFAEGDSVKRRSFSGNDWETGKITGHDVARSALGYPVHEVEFAHGTYKVPESVLKKA